MTEPSSAAPAALRETPLAALHRRRGARMVPFAGWSMPVQFDGVIAEHRQCRERAALFDVSHMGQVALVGDGGNGAAEALEHLVPMDILGIAPGRQRYALFTNESGGILDDLMVVRPPAGERGFGDLWLVVNAACAEADIRHLTTHLGHRAAVVPQPDRALLALQGPQAAVALARLAPAVAPMKFMDAAIVTLAGERCLVTRSGYTGEDGYEISVPATAAEALAEALLAMPEVAPAGLGARDTLRLEAGLCLYGNDIDTGTSPIEAGLAWAIQKVRRAGGAREGRYPGAAVIDGQLATGPLRKRVGLQGLERVPVRAGAELFDAHGRRLGHVTSGTIAPSLDTPVAMAWLGADHALPHHEVWAEVRGRRVPMRVVAMPFVPHRYAR
jgi:aminomethyltransferase